MSNQLIIENLTLGYEKHSASTPLIDHLNLTLEHGEIGCLLGQSGCGKSTLLRAIAGLHPLIKGSIVLNGKLLASNTINVQPEKRRIGLMFQDFALFPHLTVEKNIAFGLNKLSASDKTLRIQEMLDLVNLRQFSQAYSYELSGGQQQRVALARALAPKPELLLLDEPFSNLDEQSRLELSADVVRIIRQTSCKALIVTHNLNEAQTLSDRMGFLESGKLSSWHPTKQGPSQARAICA
jgi:iron(III) transport system ATP-binding protein